jgi:hypothetical protein
MALTRSSTYANALNQYKDNLSWEGDITKAQSFREAIRFLLLMRPTRDSASDGRSVDRESLKSELDAVNDYLAILDTTNRPRASFVQGRATEL